MVFYGVLRQVFFTGFFWTTIFIAFFTVFFKEYFVILKFRKLANKYLKMFVII